MFGWIVLIVVLILVVALVRIATLVVPHYLPVKVGSLVATTFSACPSYLSAVVMAHAQPGDQDWTNAQWCELSQPLTTNTTPVFLGTGGHGYSQQLSASACQQAYYPIGSTQPTSCQTWTDCIAPGLVASATSAIAANRLTQPAVCVSGVCRPNWGSGCPAEPCVQGACPPGMTCTNGTCSGQPIPSVVVQLPFVAQGQVVGTNTDGSFQVQWTRVSTLRTTAPHWFQCRAVLAGSVSGQTVAVTDPSRSAFQNAMLSFLTGGLPPTAAGPVQDPDVAGGIAVLLKSVGYTGPAPASMNAASVWPLKATSVSAANLQPIGAYSIQDYNASLSNYQNAPMKTVGSVGDAVSLMMGK
jgi:hypothetical protein